MAILGKAILPMAEALHTIILERARNAAPAATLEREACHRFGSSSSEGDLYELRHSAAELSVAGAGGLPSEAVCCAPCQAGILVGSFTTLD